MIQEEILVPSTIDGSLQPSLFYRASVPNRPLLVGLHTWSHDRFNQINNMLPYAQKNDFNLLLPEFRGSNLIDNENCTQACGSVLAKQDIKDAINFVLQEDIDATNIFLLGLSGGGHMALLMAGFCPELFKAIGAFSPITDLRKWTLENENYRRHVLACCGGDASKMLLRSPCYYTDKIAKANLKLFHGRWDTVVTPSHSIDLFRLITENHREARVYLDLFDGYHEIDMEMAMHWILSQYLGTGRKEITG